jgi:hypothetical protein
MRRNVWATRTERQREQVADAVRGNWVDTSRPADAPLSAAQPRGPAHRHVAVAAALLVGRHAAGRSRRSRRLNLFDLWIVVGCAIGAFLMRGAGCTWNDMTDRDFDAAVARTKSRPYPLGPGHPETGLRLARDPVAVAFGILLTFNWAAIALGILSLLPVAIYPFAKRFTWWPQVFLGHRVQLGRAAGLDGAYRIAGLAGGVPLSRRHRLDAVLRHDLRPSGHRGRRADRHQVHRAAVRDRTPAHGCAGSSWPRSR